MNKNRISKSVARSCAVALLVPFLIASSPDAQALDPDCISAPELTSSRQTESINMQNGVKAYSWRWYPGSDATRAQLAYQGTKVSIATGNLRNIDFGILHWGIPNWQDLRMLNYSDYTSLASINGDYMDNNGPWSAMIEDSSMFYAPPVDSGVVGMVSVKVNPAKGYRATGTVKVGKRFFRVTGVNQLKPGSSSVVVYNANFVNDIPPKGEATLVIRNGKLYRFYPNGASVPKKTGTVIQVRGPQALFVKSLVANSAVSFKLGPTPATETRMAADSVRAVGSISSTNVTLNFDAINYGYLSQYGATLFDQNYEQTTKSARVTLRILPDEQGRLIVRNVYRQGYHTKVDSGGYIVQVSSNYASTALRFKAGDVVTISRGYRSAANSKFINAAGRGPRLLQNGKFVWVCSNHSNEHRPRSAIGWNQDGQVWLITSSRGANADDGGMRMGGSTTDQMAHWLEQLGATDAVLLDGGGSTTMEIKHPEDGWQRMDLPNEAWYRSLANAFAIKSKY